MYNLQGTLERWNHKVFDNIFHRKKIVLRQLNGIARKLCEGSNRFLENLQTIL